MVATLATTIANEFTKTPYNSHNINATDTTEKELNEMPSWRP